MFLSLILPLTYYISGILHHKLALITLLFDLMCGVAGGRIGEKVDDHSATCDVITGAVKISALPTVRSILHIPSANSVIAIK
jgi:hypothetical protein